jgi:glycosyltransferase involved in cell wall biosynthesis
MPLIDLVLINLPERDVEEAYESCRHPEVNIILVTGYTGSLGVQRIDAIRRGKAKFITHCDDDDIWLPGAFDALLGAYDSSLCGVYGNEYKIKEGVTRNLSKPWSFDNQFRKRSSPHNGYLMLRQAAQPFFEEARGLHRFSDRFLQLAAALTYGPWKYVDYPCYEWRVHEGSTHIKDAKHPAVPEADKYITRRILEISSSVLERAPFV